MVKTGIYFILLYIREVMCLFFSFRGNVLFYIKELSVSLWLGLTFHTQQAKMTKKCRMARKGKTY